MYHHSALPNNHHHPQQFFSDDDDEPSLEPPPHDDTPERLQHVSQQLQDAHRVCDTHIKASKERDKKLYKIQYLIQHNQLPPSEPRPMSGLHGISVGTALKQLIQSPEQPLLALWSNSSQTNDDTSSSSLATLTCPYEMDPREGYSRWMLSLVLADTLLTGKERDHLYQAAVEPNHPVVQTQAHAVCDHLDTWIVRATAALEQKEFKGNRKPYIPGVGKILGHKQLNFREFIAPFQIVPTDRNSKYQHTTPMREWVQQRELAILQALQQAKERKRAEQAEAKNKKKRQRTRTEEGGSNIIELAAVEETSATLL